MENASSSQTVWWKLLKLGRHVRDVWNCNLLQQGSNLPSGDAIQHIQRWKIHNFQTIWLRDLQQRLLDVLCSQETNNIIGPLNPETRFFCYFEFSENHEKIFSWTKCPVDVRFGVYLLCTSPQLNYEVIVGMSKYGWMVNQLNWPILACPLIPLIYSRHGLWPWNMLCIKGHIILNKTKLEQWDSLKNVAAIKIVYLALSVIVPSEKNI